MSEEWNENPTHTDVKYKEGEWSILYMSDLSSKMITNYIMLYFILQPIPFTQFNKSKSTIHRHRLELATHVNHKKKKKNPVGQK